MTNPAANERDRRSFLKEMVGLGGALMLTGRATPALAAWGDLAAAAPMQPTVNRIGLQLYTLGRALQDDFDGSLEKVARIGYRTVEFAGYANRTPDQVRATLDRLGMTAPSTHIGLDALRNDFDGQLRIAHTIGHRYITIPSLGGDTPGASADDWKRVADEMDAMARKLKAQGIGLGFHSHRDEYVDVGGGKKGMDIIMEHTDPSTFAWEMDLGWAEVAGQNPIEWFRKYPGRIRMWHVKGISDLPLARSRQEDRFLEMRNPSLRQQPPAPAAPRRRPAGAARGAGGPGAPRGPGGAGGPGARPPAPQSVPAGAPVPVGAGDIDYKPILAQWKLSGLEYFFVEQDGATGWPGGPFSAIATSHRNLVNILT
jgi:sugar phosphate isomerase/epimerase